MTALDRVIPLPRLIEVDQVDLAVAPTRAWDMVRHGDLDRSALIHALFALRTLPDRLAGRAHTGPELRVDALRSTAERPGFQILVDDPPHEVVVGAIGQVWKPVIPFVHVADAAAYGTFADPGWVKVAWALRVLPRGDHDARIEIEVRVDATDDETWRTFRRYFRIIGPGSHAIRRILLSALARELGTPDMVENERPLLGDDLLEHVEDQLTHSVTISATPAAIWPWLVQMGCGRGGFYSIDVLDNAGVRSAREVHPELQDLAIADIIPARPSGKDGFEVLHLEPDRALILGGLYDLEAHRQLRFAAARPAHFWQVTWAFVLEPLDEHSTRLHVRARAACSPDGRRRASWIRSVHRLMQSVQLRHLAERVEGRQARDDWRDILAGLAGAGRMILAMITPFVRTSRTTWGLSPTDAARTYPGDDLVPTPRWGWTHGIEIAAPAGEVWPWVAQIGADRGGFYSYQWLENFAGCDVRNAESIHPGWQVRQGDELRLHPRMPPLQVTRVDPGRCFVAFAPPDQAARSAGKPWATGSWLFLVEPLEEERCRVISRFRAACSDDLATRLQMGPSVLEPIGFAMDRRMLLGVKERAERVATPRSIAPADRAG